MNKILLGSLIATTSLLANQMASENRVPLSGVTGSNGMVFPSGKSRIVIKNVSMDKNTAYNGDSELNDPKKRSMKVNMTNFIYRQGLSSNLDVRVIVPYVKKEASVTAPQGPKAGTAFNNDSSGLGDTKIISRYQLLNQKKGDSLFLALGFGVKLPTGSTDKDFDTPAGTSKNPPWQTGSGSTDLIAEIGITKILPNSRLDVHFMYQKNQEGDNDFQFGDSVMCSLGYSYAFTKKFSSALTLHRKNAAKNKTNSNEINYSGGTFTYLAPSLHYKLNKKFDVSASYSHMIQRDNNFDSSTNTGGLSEDSQLMLRLGYNF